MRLKLLLATVAMLLASPVLASDADNAWMDALVEQAVQRYQLPGIAVGVIEDGKVVRRITRGQLAVGEGAAINDDSLFKIASNTKAMTAAVLARRKACGPGLRNRSMRRPATRRRSVCGIGHSYNHSRARATTGSRRAALRAGRKPNSTPMQVEQRKALMMAVVE